MPGYENMHWVFSHRTIDYFVSLSCFHFFRSRGNAPKDCSKLPLHHKDSTCVFSAAGEGQISFTKLETLKMSLQMPLEICVPFVWEFSQFAHFSAYAFSRWRLWRRLGRAAMAQAFHVPKFYHYLRLPAPTSRRGPHPIAREPGKRGRGKNLGESLLNVGCTGCCKTWVTSAFWLRMGSEILLKSFIRRFHFSDWYFILEGNSSTVSLIS